MKKQDNNMYFIWIILYGFIYIIAEKTSLLLEASQLITALALSLYWIFFFVCLYRKGVLERYGICIPRHKRGAEYILYAPLLLMPFINLGMAIRSPSVIEGNAGILWGIVLVIYYGFGEEVLFRGGILSLFTNQYKTNILKSSIITSLMFSALHMVNIYSGATVRYAVIQSLCAGAMGFCFGIVTCRERSIIPCVVIHSLTNMTSLVIGNRNIIVGKTERFDLSRFEMIIYLISAAVYLFYGIWLYMRKSQENTKEREHESVY